ILSGGMTEAILSLGILVMFAVFALLYLNYLPDKTSFMVKLVGVVLAASLAALGSVGWIITPAYTAAYRNDNFMASKHSLRFTPNPQGGYAVTTIPFHFDRDFGDKLGLVDKWVDLGFDFPFYGQVWDKAYLMSDGAVSFGEALDWQDTKYRYGPLPVIFPLIVDFVSSDTFLEGASAGFFAKSAADKLTVTWSRLPEYYAHNTRYTFQLTLYPSGIFEIAYDDLPATQNYDIFEAWNTAWLIGITPGSQKSDARHIRFTADLPFTGDDRGGIVEDYYLDFRRYLHRIFAPLAYFTLGSSLFILIGFPLFFRVNLVEPLNTLLKSVRQINAGNLETEVTVMYRDEIGFLAESFNAATAKQRTLVSDLEARVAKRTVDLEAYAAQNMRLLKEEYHQREVVESLRQAMLTTSRSMDHNVVLPAILAQLREIIHFDGAGIFLLDDDCLTLVHGVGLKPTTDYLRLPVADSHYITHAFNRQETEIISGMERDPHQQLFFQDEQLGCLMVTPLLFGQQSLGVLALHRVDDILFVAEDAALLETFATQSAIAVKNAELYQQAKNAASLEERTRLAQDLHDAVNQTLFTAGIMAEAVPKVWEKDPERGRQGLEEVRRLTKGALAEMRTLLMELRPHTLIERPLGQLLRHLTDAVSSRMRIPIEMTVENDTLLSPDVQISLYRIAQESFNNIVKYAEATEVSVYLSNHPYQVILSIQDNGAGFTPAEVPPGHMGLKIMRERAESIGALLTVTSRPGDGTRVEVVWNRKG
ncbi:MAG: histidine kinase, partial [Anaerolineae bacterium]